MPMFRKKPVVIEAMQFGGDNAPAVLFWLGQYQRAPGPRLGYVNEFGVLLIRTLESGDGHHIAAPGDWIIRGVKGEFYPCKPDIFEATYEPA
jgi:hypothetical protein